jgi:hypothetical protein
VEKLVKIGKPNIQLHILWILDMHIKALEIITIAEIQIIQIQFGVIPQILLLNGNIVILLKRVTFENKIYL